MNPGYAKGRDKMRMCRTAELRAKAGRQELPENLKVLFRGVGALSLRAKLGIPQSLSRNFPGLHDGTAPVSNLKHPVSLVSLTRRCMNLHETSCVGSSNAGESGKQPPHMYNTGKTNSQRAKARSKQIL